MGICLGLSLWMLLGISLAYWGSTTDKNSIPKEDALAFGILSATLGPVLFLVAWLMNRKN